MAIKWHKEEPLAKDLLRALQKRSTHLSRPLKPGQRRGDLLIAGLGIALGLTCALFPWYIFFNQDQFGIRAMKFGGNGDQQVSGSLTLGPLPERVGAPMTLEETPKLELDLFATGTLPQDGEQDAEIVNLDEQPFPVEPPVYKVVHIENGRAMIEDETGLFIVQRGSVLPDNSRVASIEQRDGRWVVLTSDDHLIELSN
ncbi:MAG: hypothetical protein AB7I79_01715 [Rhizobiaceae bacterium]